MSNAELQFITRRVKNIVWDARRYPHTCRTVRNYLNLVFMWALHHREVKLMDFVIEQEKRIV